ncbi:MAG: hypothetical protein N3A72_01015 [bacterium]|nr:hypothetical protein [bacterium]
MKKILSLSVLEDKGITFSSPMFKWQQQKSGLLPLYKEKYILLDCIKRYTPLFTIGFFP